MACERADVENISRQFLKRGIAMRDRLIVYSGGIDSTAMLYEYADTIALAVNFHYGSNHNERERECARENCRRLGIELIEINLDFMKRHFESSLLSGAEAIPGGDYDEGNMRSTVVPFRNGIMLSIAAGLAESRDLKEVMIANHAGDHSIYPDCRPEFVKAMSEAIEAGTYEHLKIFAPYTNISKTEIIGRGSKAGVDFSLTYSCYRGQKNHCGVCGTCRERRQSFIDANIPDPTSYND